MLEKGRLVVISVSLPLVSFLHRNRKLRIAILVAAGLCVAILIYIWPSLPRSDVRNIQYSPGDIVYSHPLQAVHNMSAINSTVFPNISTANADPNPVPEIVISEHYYDFGVIDSFQVLTRTFVIANHGLVPLVILNAYTTCGCTVADFTTTEIPPGKVALMTIRFDPAFHDLRGATVRRGVIFSTNDPIHPLQEVWIQASVR